MEPVDLCAQLRSATDPVHEQVENLPLAQAMAAGTVSRADYIRLVQLLLAAHRGWEAEVEQQACCAAVWSPVLRRVAVLERDLIALGAEAEPAEHPAVESWLTDLRDRAETQPEVWLGVIYLFEGSRMGSMALLRPVARAMGVMPAPGVGVDYHLDGIADRVPRWQRLKATLNALPLTVEQRAAATAGALTAFRMLHEVYSAPAATLAAR